MRVIFAESTGRRNRRDGSSGGEAQRVNQATAHHSSVSGTPAIVETPSTVHFVAPMLKMAVIASGRHAQGHVLDDAAARLEPVTRLGAIQHVAER